MSVILPKRLGYWLIHGQDIQGDLTDPLEDRENGFKDPVDVGLPPVDVADIPDCGTWRSGGTPCTRKGMLP